MSTKHDPPEVALTVHLEPSVQPLVVGRGTRITAVFPHNPLGTWTAPRVSRPELVRTSVRRAPAGMAVEIVALAPGFTTVAVHTTPHGDPRPPGRIRLPDWELQLTVSDE